MGRRKLEPMKVIRVPLVLAKQLEEEAHERGMYLTDYLKGKKVVVVNG